MRQWLCSLQNYFENKIPFFYTISCKIPFKINSLICPKTNSATHCVTELFPIYQNKHWTIRRREVILLVYKVDHQVALAYLYHILNKCGTKYCVVQILDVSKYYTGATWWQTTELIGITNLHTEMLGNRVNLWL